MTNINKLVSALVAIAGIWLVFRQFPDYAATAYLVLTDSPSASPVSFLKTQSIHFFVSVVIGFVLVLGRNRIANWLTSGTEQESFEPESLLSAGVAVVSVFFILSGLVSVGQNVVVEKAYGGNSLYMLWEGVFSALVGVFGLIASVGVGRVWSYLRGR